MKNKKGSIFCALAALGLVLALLGPGEEAYASSEQSGTETVASAPEAVLISSWNGLGRFSIQSGRRGVPSNGPMMTTLTPARPSTARLSAMLGITLAGGMIILVVYASLRPGGRLRAAMGKLEPDVEELHRMADTLSEIGDSFAREARERSSRVKDCTASLTEVVVRNQQNLNRSALLRSLAEKAGDDLGPGADHLVRLSAELDYIRKEAVEIGRLARKMGRQGQPPSQGGGRPEAGKAGEPPWSRQFDGESAGPGLDGGSGFSRPDDQARAPAGDQAGDMARCLSLAMADISALAGNMTLRADAGLVVAARCRELIADQGGTSRLVSALAGDMEEASERQRLGLNQLCSAMLRLDNADQSGISSVVRWAVAGDRLSARAEAVLKKVDDLAAIVGVSMEGGSNRYFLKTASSLVKGEGEGEARPGSHKAVSD